MVERGSGTGPILLSQATFLLAHIANSGPVPLSAPLSLSALRFPLSALDQSVVSSSEEQIAKCSDNSFRLSRRALSSRSGAP